MVWNSPQKRAQGRERAPRQFAASGIFSGELCWRLRPLLRPGKMPKVHVLPRPDQLLILGALTVVALDVVVENLFELSHDGVASQSGVELAVDVHRGLGFFEKARQADAEVGMLRFAGAVHHATHDS